MTGVLVYSERDDLACDLLAWATTQKEALGPALAVVLGENASKRAEKYQSFGPERVYTCDDKAVSNFSDEVLSAALVEVVNQADAAIVLIGATRRGRSLAPRLAQGLEAGCINDAFELKIESGELVAGRFALGGNTVSIETITSQIQVLTIVPGTVDHAEPREKAGEIIPLSLDLEESRCEVVERREKPPTSVDITNSDRLVCVGRGLEKQDDLQLASDLAKVLEGEVACTRPLSYEQNWLPEDSMIGISGKKVSPRLLLSLGVSGEVQHTVGIMGATIIVAVNNDANAPIFKLADYSIVADLYEVTPKLVEQLQKRR